MAERRIEPAEHRVDPDVLRWAAEQAPRLLEQARAEALDEVRARLRSRLVDALMNSAGMVGWAGEEAPGEEVSGDEVSNEPLADPPLGVWVYGVLDGDAPAPVDQLGVDPAHDVEVIRHAGLAALVSRVSLEEYGEQALHESLEDLDRLEVLARAHEAVLDEALQRGAVVPFRICTIYESAERVREMLAREHQHLAAGLRHLQGMTEWGVKAYAVGPPEDGAANAAPASGTDYLSGKRAERNAAETARQVVDAAVEAVHARLRQGAAEAVLSPSQRSPLSGHEGEMVLNASYLVPNSDVDRFRGLVEELARRHRGDGLEVELTGPWPAYHFSEAAA